MQEDGCCCTQRVPQDINWELQECRGSRDLPDHPKLPSQEQQGAARDQVLSHICRVCVCRSVFESVSKSMCNIICKQVQSVFQRAARCESVHRACLEMPCPPCSVATSSMPCKSMMPPPKLHNIQVALFNDSQDFASSVLTTYVKILNVFCIF